ncbi:sulfotransferase family cytosolic 1B member 1-like [Carcharodon carcharias]|uniref:sulfotransferase family cytosolic 1B member 1-like n=1 Tax=Carcharodon carcharias TaxID=13397 RepID=UPI001B7E187A|nr:sulfotransferase family cytosolic 1B member 1-like [Carcharodon carcharias]
MSSRDGTEESSTECEVKRPKLVPLRGVPMPDIFLENWEAVESFQADPQDLLIATYPKAGTTWVQEIVDFILQDGDPERCRRAPIHSRIPYLEFNIPGHTPSGTELLAKLPSPKVIKTHLPFQLLPRSFLDQKCKIIYCARNAKDNLVSFFFFDLMNKVQPEPGSWEEYFHKFLQGNVSYGLWHDHVLGWWVNKDKYPILYIFYEDIKENPKQEILKIMRFLGKELPDAIVDRIVHHTSFQSMKANPMSNYSTVPANVFDRTMSTFMRKGVVGDWKNYFTVTQDEAFNSDYEQRMQGSDLQFRTEL